MRRLMRLGLGVAVVAALVWAACHALDPPLLGTPILHGDLIVVGEDGDHALLRGDAERWWLVDASDAPPRPLTVEVIDVPLVDRGGRVLAWTPGGLLAWDDPSGPLDASAATTLLASDALHGPPRLLGTLADGRPLVSEPSRRVRRVLVVEAREARAVQTADGVPLRMADGHDVAGSRLIVSPRAAAVALEGPEGWELWDLRTIPARRHVAQGHRGAGAVFTPDGSSLIVPGKIDDLWRMDLEHGAVAFMADGNLGASRRVGTSSLFRGEPVMLLAPQWDTDGFLGLVHTNLGGGGRLKFKPAFMHHYAVDGSRDGRFLVYCQAQFDERSDEAFDEELYAFDFEHSADSRRLDARRARAPTLAGVHRGRGPFFVGDGAVVLYEARGDIYRVDLLTPNRG